MVKTTRKIRIASYLKEGTQEKLGAMFDRSQGWVSKINKGHPEARLEEVNGQIVAIEYANKVRKVRINY